MLPPRVLLLLLLSSLTAAAAAPTKLDSSNFVQSLKAQANNLILFSAADGAGVDLLPPISAVVGPAHAVFVGHIDASAEEQIADWFTEGRDLPALRLFLGKRKHWYDGPMNAAEVAAWVEEKVSLAKDPAVVKLTSAGEFDAFTGKHSHTLVKFFAVRHSGRCVVYCLLAGFREQL